MMRRGRVVATAAAVLGLATIAVGGLALIRATASYRDKLLGDWEWQEGNISHLPLSFPCWIFARDGRWGISDDFEYYPAGDFKLFLDRLTLQESRGFSENPATSKHRLRFLDEDTLILDSGDGVTSRWKRRTEPLTPAVVYPPANTEGQ